MPHPTVEEKGHSHPALIFGVCFTPNSFLLTVSLKGNLSVIQTFSLHPGPEIKGYSFVPNLFCPAQAPKWGSSLMPNSVT